MNKEHVLKTRNRQSVKLKLSKRDNGGEGRGGEWEGEEGKKEQ